MPTSDRGMPLSLLSRGIGLLIRNGQEKVEVYFEPQDYLNWRVTGGRHPVCRCSYWPPGGLAKTYTTRKGPLLLYSEELAYPAHLYQEDIRQHQRSGHRPILPQQLQPHHQAHLNQQALLFQQTQLNHSAQLRRRARVARRRPGHPDRNEEAVTAQLKTLSDLTDAILIYGCRQIVGGQQCPIIQPSPSARESRIRPGYSARRYLCNWFHSWDEALLLKLHNSGRISYSTLYREGRWSPRAFRKPHYDLSAVPQPYQLTGSMLQAPGPTLLCRSAASYDVSGDETEEAPQGSSKQMTLLGSSGASSYPDSVQLGMIGKCFDQFTSGHQLEPSSQDVIVKESINRMDGLKPNVLPPIGAHISPTVRERPPPLHRTLIDTSHLRSLEENRSFASFYGGSLAGNRRNVSITVRALGVVKRDPGCGAEDLGRSRFPVLADGVPKEAATKAPPSDAVKLPLITMEPPATPQKQQPADNVEGEAEQRKRLPQTQLPPISQARSPTTGRQGSGHPVQDRVARTWGLIKQGATQGGVKPFEVAKAKPATGGTMHSQVARDAAVNRMARGDQGATSVRPQRDRSPDRRAIKIQGSAPAGGEPERAAKERDGALGVHWHDAVNASCSEEQPVSRATDMERLPDVAHVAAGESFQYYPDPSRELPLLGKEGPSRHDSAASVKSDRSARDTRVTAEKGDALCTGTALNPEDIEVAETPDPALKVPPETTVVTVVGAGEVSGVKAEPGCAKPGGAAAPVGPIGGTKASDAAEGSCVKAGACSITFEGSAEGGSSGNKLNGGVTKAALRAGGSTAKPAGGGGCAGEGTTVVKGNLPEELRATHTGGDFTGSAVLAPDGEIVKLSMLRAALYFDTKGHDGAGNVLVFNVTGERCASADEQRWNELLATSQLRGDEDVKSVESGVMEDEDYADLPVSNKQSPRDLDTQKGTTTENETAAFSALSQGAGDSGLFLTSPVPMSSLPGTVMGGVTCPAVPQSSYARVKVEVEAPSRELDSSLSPDETIIVEDGRTGQRSIRSRQTLTQTGPPSRSKASISIILPSQGMDDPESFRSDEDGSGTPLSNTLRDSKEHHVNINVSETSQKHERSAEETGKSKVAVSRKGKRPEARADKDRRSAQRPVETRERTSVRGASADRASLAAERRPSSNDLHGAWDNGVGEHADEPSEAETRAGKETTTKASDSGAKAKANQSERGVFVVGPPRKTRTSEATLRPADQGKARSPSKKDLKDELKGKKSPQRSAAAPAKGGRGGADGHDSERGDDSVFQNGAEEQHRQARRQSQERGQSLSSQISEGQLEPGKETGSGGHSPALSEREARRAAAVEQRRLEIERRRQEHEAQRLHELEQQGREELMRAELDEARRRREEEARAKKQHEEVERLQVQELERKRLEREQAERERERRQQEEHRRKLLEIQRRKQEEEAVKKAERERLEREESERRAEEERALAQLDESERLEYERQRREEDEQRRVAEEQRRRVMEEEARLAVEVAKRQAIFLAKQQADLERHLMFHRELWLETSGMEQTQDVSRPWVYSYYELLQMLGLQRSELEAEQHVD